jgi:hypothetical protein
VIESGSTGMDTRSLRLNAKFSSRSVSLRSNYIACNGCNGESVWFQHHGSVVKQDDSLAVSMI